MAVMVARMEIKIDGIENGRNNVFFFAFCFVNVTCCLMLLFCFALIGRLHPFGHCGFCLNNDNIVFFLFLTEIN